MYLIEIFLPLADNEGLPFPPEQHEAVECVLADRFGGVTAYPRAPASGLWKVSPTKSQQDDFVDYEVMTEELDALWWADYRQHLEKFFHQEKLLIRAQRIDVL